MEEIVEIILRAIDDASNVFSSVSGSAEEMGSAIEQSANEGSSGFDEMGSAADNAGGSIQDIIDYCQEVDGSPMDDAATSADNLEQETLEAADALMQFGDAGQFMAAETLMDAFQQLADGMWSAADAAGTFHDSINRAGLEAQGAGISVEDMTNTVNELADTTGRAGSQIRESFIIAVARGVTDMDSFKTMMEGAGAQAYLLGTDVETMADRFSKMAMRSTLMERSLNETGITMEELATAMGMTGATADEVKQKWQELDTNQRAAILGMAASMNEGETANSEYKHSWEGLQNQIDIAKGKLERIVGDVLLPVLVPAFELAGTILQGFGDVVSWVMSSPLGGLVSVLGAAAGMFLLVVTGVSALSTMVSALGLASTFSAIETIALTIAEEGLSIASIQAALSSVGLTGGLIATATAAWGAATAVWALLAPLLPFIAAAAAVVLVIYELGKAFGWWTDVGSMIDAIWSGLQRLWDAFINHPDVQAVIKAIGDAWNWVVSGIQWVIGAIMEFFGISTGGDFDIVRAIIDGIGFAWQIISIPLRLVISLTQALIGAFQWLWNVLSPLGEFLMSVLTPIWQATADILMQIIGYVMSVVEVFGQLLDGTANLGDVFNTVWGGLIDLISNVASVIWDTIVAVVTNVATSMLEFASNMLTWAVQAGWNFLTGIVTWLSQLPGRVYTFLVQVAQYIWTQTANWVKTAVQKASDLVTGVINWIKQLPMKVYTFLIQVLTKIIDTGRQWVEGIKQKAKELVDGAVNKVKELPGKIASAIKGVTEALVKPFRDAWNQIKPIMGLIGQAGNQTASGGDAWGTDMAWGSDELSYNVGSQEYKVTQTLVLDLQNVPATMSESTLVDLLSNKKVLQALTGNKDFQDFDMRMKKEIQNRSIRARGV